MIVDYKLLADNDPGGYIETAFAAMQAETVTSAQDRKLSYIDIANEAGFQVATNLQLKIKAAIDAGVFPDLVDSALKGDGININDPQVAVVISTLGLSAGDEAAVLDLQNVTSAKYPNLRIGHLSDARRKRERGEV
tara:strand:+ start:11128 stop:11535 length:408 start_codon:yes stop_codon:yes gene_type:complete